MDHPEALQMLAEMNYWTGGKPNVSYTYLDKILAPYPDNEPANRIKKRNQTEYCSTDRISISILF
ncbi:hypothetical protein [Algoriphagus boritolerans]|uniref:hypothetical protein n=1 Tax=Algoriphagus boritolerans TaxID=308111 RepID=UPI000AE53483